MAIGEGWEAVSKSKLDKAMDECQEVLYSVLVQYLKEDKDETNTTNNPKR
jgi:hypothetical protein